MKMFLTYLSLKRSFAIIVILVLFLICDISCKLSVKKINGGKQRKINFIPGRIPPGKFEYSGTASIN